MVANTKASKINMAIFSGLVGGCRYLGFGKFYLFYRIKAAPNTSQLNQIVGWVE